MKLKVIAAVIPMLFAASSFADVEGGSSTVKFTGSITASTCEIETSSLDKVVALGDVASTTLVNNGVSVDKNFSIELTGCTVVEDAAGGLTGAYIKFNGDTVNDATTLKTANSDVGIEVKQNGAAVVLDGSKPTESVSFSDDGKAVFDFTANYKNIGGATVAAGDASATADFTVYYQ